MNESFDRNQISESDGRQTDEAKVEGSAQRPILPTCKEDRSDEEKADDQQNADHDGNVYLKSLIIG